MRSQLLAFSFFFFNDTATTEIYTLSLHDALPISTVVHVLQRCPHSTSADGFQEVPQLHRRKLPETLLDLPLRGDRKSTRLNSSHGYISYAVFCLKKKKKKTTAFNAHINVIETNRA